MAVCYGCELWLMDMCLSGLLRECIVCRIDDVVAHDFDIVGHAFFCVDGQINQHLFFHIEIFEKEEKQFFDSRFLYDGRSCFVDCYCAVARSVEGELIGKFDIVVIADHAELARL